MKVMRGYYIDNIGYSQKDIIRTLNNYAAIWGGAFDKEDDGQTTAQSVFHAPFEGSILAKVDIDRAISSWDSVPGMWENWNKGLNHPAGYNLTPKQYVIALYIYGFDSPEQEYENVRYIDSLAGEIADILTPKTKKPAFSEPLILEPVMV